MQYYTVTENVNIAKSVYRMTLAGDTGKIAAAGQFINIKIENLFLRRPISVCDYNEKEITIIYKVVGKGTEKLSEMPVGRKLDVLTGLGNGYDLAPSGEKPLLIGGGVGVPPLYNLAKKLLAAGKMVTVILGFNTAEEVFYEDRFKALGAEVFVTTADGSYGTKGFVTAIKPEYSYVYACGPEPMLKAVYAAYEGSGQFSFEERMGCGFGACMGCTCKTKYGNKRICKDGPVLKKEEIVW
ncbi:MAG: dihydroorotate dehydrogenase electron transfer subunit [Bacillota bacterium]|nr:MAG: dihydroorotate dehydrogenase electron transfer subunit [Bacillota bacterium]